MDLLERVAVLVGAHEGDSETLGTEPARAAHSVQVRVGVTWHIEVEHDVDLLDVDTAAEQLRRHKNAIPELLEALIDLDSLFEGHAAVDGLGGDGVLVEHFVQLDGVVHLADKDDHLVELQLVNEVHQLADLVALVQADVVLAQTVQRQLALVFDEDLGWIAHELAAGKLDLIGKRRGEHHHLLAVRGLLENLLDVTSHVCTMVMKEGSLLG